MSHVLDWTESDDLCIARFGLFHFRVRRVPRTSLQGLWSWSVWFGVGDKAANHDCLVSEHAQSKHEAMEAAEREARKAGVGIPMAFFRPVTHSLPKDGTDEVAP